MIIISKIKLKCINSSGEIVLASKLNPCGTFFLKSVWIAFRNESYKLFFQEDA